MEIQNCRSCGREREADARFCSFCGEVVAQTPTDPLLGRVLNNQFVLERRLGEGGFGAVYLAKQPSIERNVAVKVLHRHWGENELVRKRFQREARVTARLRHHSSVQVYSVGDTSDGYYWMALEYLDGQTLQQYLQQQPERRLSVEETLVLLKPICEVLQEAHELGILHRDLKPENIMLVRDEKGGILPKLLDFGIAGVREEANSLTGSLGFLGTPVYMPPEAWKSAKQTVPQSDIYAMGMILYKCVTGALPFEADTPMVWMQKHVSEPPKEISYWKVSIPTMLQQIIQKCLEKEPEARYESAKELLAALQTFEQTQQNIEAMQSMASAVPEKLPTSAAAPTLVQSPSPITIPEPKPSRLPEIPLSSGTAPKLEQERPNSSTSQFVDPKGRYWVLGIAATLLCIAVVVFWQSSAVQKLRQESSPQTTSTTVASSTSIAPSNAPIAPSTTLPLASQPLVEKPRFVNHGDGTVSDTVTGLMWASEDSYKNGKKNGLSWKEAQQYCTSYRKGGYSDWRMPTLAELKELYSALSKQPLGELERKYWSKRGETCTTGERDCWQTESPRFNVSEGESNTVIWIYYAIWSNERINRGAMMLNFALGYLEWANFSLYSAGFGALPVRTSN